MGDKTGISWADATWNPVVGCSRVSAGCENCYAEGVSHRMASNPVTEATYAGLTVERAGRPTWSNVVRCLSERLDQPLRWKRPRRIFVNSMSDLFHEQVPEDFLDEVFAVMSLCPQHTFLVLTKRPQRMRDYVGNTMTRHERVGRAVVNAVQRFNIPMNLSPRFVQNLWPLINVWKGVSVEDQETADARIRYLVETPATVRFLSCEPLLGLVDLRLGDSEGLPSDAEPFRERHHLLHWVIAGGESGPNARPMHPDWARSLRDQCAAAGVPFFFKQWGEWVPTGIEPGGDLGGQMRRGITRIVHAPGNPDGHFRRGDAYMSRVGKRAAGHLLDGKEYREYPR